MRAAATSYTLEDQERMTRATNYFAWQHRLVRRELGQRVLEIGCGIGNFTRLLLDRKSVVAIDIEAQCVDRLKHRFAGQTNLRGLVCDVMAPGFLELRSSRSDSCVCLNVLEHIEDDLEALRRIASVLSPGGVAILIVPAFPGLYGPIDILLGHHRRYTRAAISLLAQSAGFQVKTARYLNAIGFFGWWINSHVLRRTTQSASQIEVFDRYIVPIASRVESWVDPPFGQSLFVVLKKG